MPWFSRRTRWDFSRSSSSASRALISSDCDLKCRARMRCRSRGWIIRTVTAFRPAISPPSDTHDKLSYSGLQHTSTRGLPHSIFNFPYLSPLANNRARDSHPFSERVRRKLKKLAPTLLSYRSRRPNPGIGLAKIGRAHV